MFTSGRPAPLGGTRRHLGGTRRHLGGTRRHWGAPDAIRPSSRRPAVRAIVTMAGARVRIFNKPTYAVLTTVRCQTYIAAHSRRGCLLVAVGTGEGLRKEVHCLAQGQCLGAAVFRPERLKQAPRSLTIEYVKKGKRGRRSSCGNREAQASKFRRDFGGQRFKKGPMLSGNGERRNLVKRDFSRFKSHST